jgi:phospholipid/cholesterol/gamma-HCH transport system permease protein
MSPSLTAFVRGTRPFLEAAERLITAFTPSAWTPDIRRQAMRRLWAEARQILPRFVLLSGLLSLAIVHIVLTTSDNYGLSGFALATVMRLLVVELLPLLAAVNVALTPPVRGAGAPQVISRCLLVIIMATLSSTVALAIAYLGMYGLTPWGLGIYTHTVGQVFEPVVLIALAMKTLLFAMTVATLNSAALTFGALLGIEILLLVIEFL